MYICMDSSGFPGRRPTRALVTSRRDLDAPKRSRDVPTPKKRMLGLAPSIFFRVDVAKTRERVFGDPQKYLYIWSVRKTTNKNSVCVSRF